MFVVFASNRLKTHLDLFSILSGSNSLVDAEVDAYHGETLRLYRVTRQMMAAYMCIASNDVPPAVSKRVPLNVNCKSKTL